MIFLILVIMFLSFLWNIFVSSKTGVKGAESMSSILLFLVLFLTVLNFYEMVMMGVSSSTNAWSWFNFSNYNLKFSFFNDNLTSMMLMVVLSMSSLVHYYSSAYMEGDPHLSSFLSYLSFFTFLMLILVTSSNLLQLFMGWEGVGLCSYLLVSYWYTSNSAVKSALKAILVNSMGDLGFLLGSNMLILSVGSLNFEDMNSIELTSSNTCFFLSICFIMAAAGKSAQFGLHSWLPDAMEGPTPVSALIHAATMVTAGIFLIMSMSKIFNYNSTAISMVLLLGSLTAMFAASIGLVQNDFKKVIAYSTCSQLGYMALICGISEYSLSLFHLFNHAFFKALLFLSAGSLIHSLSDEQDFSKSGNLIWSSQLSFVCITIGSLALMGLPFLTGFYSKDTMLELVNCSYLFSTSFILALIAASFTAFYSFSLLIMGVLKEEKGSKLVKMISLESNMNLTLSLMILTLMSLIMGFFSMNFFKLESIPNMNSFSKQLPLMISFMGAMSTLMMCSSIKLINMKKNIISQMIEFYGSNAWTYDLIMNNIISSKILYLGEFFYHKIDSQSMEILGPHKINYLAINLTSNLNYYQTGSFHNYMMFFMSFLMFTMVL